MAHPKGIPDETLAEVTRYTKLFWLNTGPYNNLTARKFLLNLDRQRADRGGARSRQINGAQLDAGAGRAGGRPASSAMRRMFFDPDFEPMVTNKTPGEGEDILASSANNLYDGVTHGRSRRLHGAPPAELAARQARRPPGGGGLQGRRPATTPSIAPHRVAPARRGRHRAAGAGSAPSTRARPVLRNRRATPTARPSTSPGCRTATSAVDTMNGFIEVYMDARGMKGAWEGVVYYANHEKTDKIRALATHAQWFEDHMPVDPKYRKPTVHRRVGHGHRGGGRDRRLGADHADRRQPAERPAHPRAARQQVACRCRTSSRPTKQSMPDQLPPGVRLGRCRGGARRALGRVRRAS